MSARHTAEVIDAVAYAVERRCTPGHAADLFGVHRTSVMRALRKLGLAPNPKGRPKPAGC